VATERGRTLSPASFERLVALLDASLEIELRELARASRGAVFRDLPDVSWAVGAVSGPSVYRTRLDSAAAPGRIAELSDGLATFGPVTWWAGPSAEPAELPDLLVDAGYRLEDDEAGMAVDLHWLVEDLPRPDGLRIQDVERRDGSLDDDALEAWLEVNRRTLGWPDEKVVRRRALYRDDERRPRPWRHFIGRLDGAPVSASRVLVTDDVAMVHGVCTVPEARRQGSGSALTLAALVAARDLGCRVAVLQASSMGQGPYRRLGFRFVAPYGRFVREGAAAEPAGAGSAGAAQLPGSGDGERSTEAAA
jgi:GNAT superfamily N-acetyltransferase